MARAHGCYVYGIDLSVNMILTALERAAAAGNGDKARRRRGRGAAAAAAAAHCRALRALTSPAAPMRTHPHPQHPHTQTGVV